MKRLAWLVVIAVLSLNSLGFSSPNFPIASSSSIGSNPPAVAGGPGIDLSIPGKGAHCSKVHATRICVSVSNRKPADGSYVTVYGQLKLRGTGIRGKIMTASWRYKGKSHNCTAVTDSAGLASCVLRIGGVAKGQNVHISVTIGNFSEDTSITGGG
jgi:hypothetical protein